MRLYIVRHGIAVDRADPAATTDEERWLTDEGKAKTRLVALGLQALGVEIDAIFSSPLVRARQTAEVLAKVLHPARRLRLTETSSPASPSRPCATRSAAPRGPRTSCSSATSPISAR